MKANVGSADKVIRIVIGLAIIVLGIVFKSWWGALGLLPLATVVLSWCPLYVPLGITTRKATSQPPPTGGQA
jgi:predicted RND superfamily exporter protein